MSEKMNLGDALTKLGNIRNKKAFVKPFTAFSNAMLIFISPKG